MQPDVILAISIPAIGLIMNLTAPHGESQTRITFRQGGGSEGGPYFVSGSATINHFAGDWEVKIKADTMPGDGVECNAMLSWRGRSDLEKGPSRITKSEGDSLSREITVTPGLRNALRLHPTSLDSRLNDHFACTLLNGGEVTICGKIETAATGDVDGNGIVGSHDLGAVIGANGQCGSLIEDIDQNGCVDAADIAALLGQWSQS